MSALADFVLARVEEDEAVAFNPGMLGLHYGADSAIRSMFSRRVLRECLAKRQIIGAYQDQRDHGKALAESKAVPELALTFAAMGMAAAELAVRHLAAIYAEHPDYDDDWRP